MAGTTGTVTIVEDVIGTVKKIKFSFVCGSSSQGGEATGATENYYNGIPIMCASVPSTASGYVPEANWDITITDVNSNDILRGIGANRSTDATDYIQKSTDFLPVVNTKLTLNVTNGGSSAVGDIYLYLYPATVN